MSWLFPFSSQCAAHSLDIRPTYTYMHRPALLCSKLIFGGAAFLSRIAAACFHESLPTIAYTALQYIPTTTGTTTDPIELELPDSDTARS